MSSMKLTIEHFRDDDRQYALAPKLTQQQWATNDPEHEFYSVIVVKYDELNEYRYEIMFEDKLVRKYGGENYPPLPDDIAVTLGMVDNYHATHNAHVNTRSANLAMLIKDQIGEWTTPYRASMWAEHARVVWHDEFLDSVGRILDMAIVTVNGITTRKLMAYSLYLRNDRIKELKDGYP